MVVDPYRTPTAEAADIHLMPKPGTDGALACAVMHVLFKEGFADRAYLATYTAGAAELEAHLETRTPAWASDISGVPEQEILDFARLYGRTKRSFIRVGYGFSRSRNGSAQLFAVTCLPAVTGAWQHKGGGALYANAGIYGVDRSLIEGLDILDPKTRIFDQSRIGPVLTGDKRDLGDGPPVTALLIQNTNPMVVAPETLSVRDGFRRADLFTCVHEQFMTETAAMADVVLPATTFLEHDDIYTGGGHTFLQIARKAVEPHGAARTNHYVITELARRLGAEHRGFGMPEMEIVAETLRLSGLPGPESFYQGRWIDRAIPFETAHFLDGFGHQDKRFHFQADWASLGPLHRELPALPDHVDIIDKADAQHPFRMMAPPTAPSSRQQQLQQHALECHPRGHARRADPSRGSPRARPRNRRPRAARQPAGQRGGAGEILRQAAAGRARGRGHLAEPRLRGRPRHQRADLRRSRPPHRRRRLPRHRSLGARRLERIPTSWNRPLPSCPAPVPGHPLPVKKAWVTEPAMTRKEWASVKAPHTLS